MRQFKSKAEYYRHHRKCFELALDLGCTPKEAEAVLDQVEARERHRAFCARHGGQSALPPLQIPSSRADFERWDAPYMMRD